MKKILAVILCTVFLTGHITIFAEDVSYLPHVTKEMSDATYWADENEVLMSMDEIEAQNEATLSEKATYMYDLKNQAGTVNTVSLNEALLKSSWADAKYYLGWTYLESDKKATEEEFEELVLNTQNPNPKKEDEVLYAVAVKRTNLHTFPSNIAIWDDPKDPECNYQYLVGLRVNEPVVITSVSNDGKYYLAKSICCSGWVPSEDVAICKDKEEWISAWDIPREDVLVVYTDKLYTEMSVTGKETSEILLTMGTVLELKRVENPNELVDNRAAYQNYGVYIPIRNEDGSYSKKLTLIPEKAKVSVGYLPLTKKNIVSVAFEALGNTYGWGSWLNSDDCSSYMRNIYKCFGLELARNTTWQAAMPMVKADMTNMCREERIKVMDSLPPGSMLYFSGHTMMYLGKVDGKYYVVSAVGSIMEPWEGGVRQRLRSTVINTLDIKRASGITWLDALTCAVVPYYTNETLPGKEWYNLGVDYCIKNGILTPDEEGFFNPEKHVSYQEVINAIWVMEGKMTTELGDDSEAWAISSGFVRADEASLLLSENNVTREEFVVMLYRYALYKEYDVSVGENTNILSYEDAFEITEGAHEAIAFAAGSGILEGKTENTLNHSDLITRSEAAVMIERFINLNK